MSGPLAPPVAAPPVAAQVVRVLPEVSGLHKEFDYSVPEAWSDRVEVGTRVRIQLGPRRVGGWVTATGVVARTEHKLRPLAGITGMGPSAEIVELAYWAAWRYAGRRSALLGAASPERVVVSLPRSIRQHPTVTAGAGGTADVIELAWKARRAVLRLPPADDPVNVVLAGLNYGRNQGPVLVVVPSTAQAGDLAVRLSAAGAGVALVPGQWAQAAGGADVVIGARSAVWAPCANLGAVVVVDGHDEGLHQEQAPTWNGWVVAAERAERAGVPIVITSPCPGLDLLAWGELFKLSRTAERAGWAALNVVDRRRDDPRTGLYSPSLVRFMQGADRVVCVLNRKGRARLLACASCGELSCCEACGAAVRSVLGAGPGGELACPRCGLGRPMVCARCGSMVLKFLRIGVARAVEELAALTGRRAVEVSGDVGVSGDLSAGGDLGDLSASGDLAGSGHADGRRGGAAPALLVGTEAVLHRVASADAVAFLDFDQELSAPRYRAAEEALALLARASRIVGGRRGRVLVQTRQPEHPALRSALMAEPERLAEVDRPLRRALRFPPVTAVALVSGAAAAEYVAALTASAPSLDVIGPDEDRWLIRAADSSVLADGLASVARPAGRLRIEVDPPRL